MPLSKAQLAKAVSRQMENSVAAPLRALGEDAAYMATVGVEDGEIDGMFSERLSQLLSNLVGLHPRVRRAGELKVSDDFHDLLYAIRHAIFALGLARGILEAGGDPRDAMADVSVTLEGV